MSNARPGDRTDGIQTLKLLDGFPNDEMVIWMEEIEGKVLGTRDP